MSINLLLKIKYRFHCRTLGGIATHFRTYTHGDKIDRLRSFLPFWEAKIENATFIFFLVTKTEENAVKAAKK